MNQAQRKHPTMSDCGSNLLSLTGIIHSVTRHSCLTVAVISPWPFCDSNLSKQCPPSEEWYPPSITVILSLYQPPVISFIRIIHHTRHSPFLLLHIIRSQRINTVKEELVFWMIHRDWSVIDKRMEWSDSDYQWITLPVFYITFKWHGAFFQWAHLFLGDSRVVE